MRKDASSPEIRIGNRLRQARTALELTQQQVADRAGVTRQTIGLIESGDYNPTIRLCLKLARITGQSLDELFWAESDEGEQDEI